MPKIAMIGAGSLIFCKTLSMDILATPSLRGSELRLMSPTKGKLDRIEGFLKRVIKDNKLPASVWSTTDRREALRGADYVICMIQVGGLDAFRLDYEIPLKYGVDQCIGDTLGPGGVMRALRTIPVLMEIAKDMEELCPDALLLNYANPMATCCLALGRSHLKGRFVGLCHGIQTTLDLIAGYLKMPKEQVDFRCAGINHMAWFLSLKDKVSGKDLYPAFKELFERPEYYANEKVRGEVMRHFGYFMTESTGHLSEYLPWFRSSENALKLYCDEPGFGGESGAYVKYCVMLESKYKGIDYLASESAALGRRSAEYCSYILEAKETGRPFRLNGNIVNEGLIDNLPQGSCVEVPLTVDGTGFHPEPQGALPVQCAALNMSNVMVQTLAADAALSGDPELVMQAMAIDPLSSTRLTLKEARDMASELLKAESKWLPQFAGKSMRAVPGISVGPDVKKAEVPLDPALAIVHRFSELASRQLK